MGREIQVNDYIVVSDGQNEKQFKIVSIQPNQIKFSSNTQDGILIPSKNGWIIPNAPNFTFTFYPGQDNVEIPKEFLPSPDDSPVKECSSSSNDNSEDIFSSGPIINMPESPVNLWNVKLSPEGEVVGNGYVTLKNGRSHEDRYLSGTLNDIIFYAVFDGHGGDDVVETIISEFPNYLAQDLYDVDWEDSDGIKARVQRSVDRFEIDHIVKPELKAGSTMALALVTDNYIYLINLGDSVVLVFNSKGEILIQTNDHEPNSEFDRIKSVGSFVFRGRVEGTLAVSRSFGDLDLKDIDGKYSSRGPVSLEIGFSRIQRTDDQYLMLFSDGLTERNLAAIEHEYPDLSVHEILVKRALEAEDLDTGCKQLVSDAQNSGSSDDITIMIIKL